MQYTCFVPCVSDLVTSSTTMTAILGLNVQENLDHVVILASVR